MANSDFQIPAKGKAAIVVNEGPDFHLEVIDVDIPEIKDDELLLKLNCTGLCMSDIHYMMNDWDVPSMSSLGVQCPGHEGAGFVAKVGSSVKGWKVGDRAGLKPLLDVCHNCEHCWNGRENYCAGGVYTGLAVEGSYREYIASPAIYTSRIPDGVPDEVAGPIMCSASTMHRCLIEGAFKPGDWIVFPGGGGGVGIQGVMLAKAMGMRPIVIDGGAEKKKLSLECGAEAYIDFTEVSDTAAEVKKIADGIGAHGVVVTAYQAYKTAFSLLGDRVGGTIMVIALPPKGTVIVGAEPGAFVFKNTRVIGSLVGTMQDTAAALEYARRGLLKGIAEVRGLSRINESCQALKEGKIAGRIVIDFNRWE